ncbi:MAG: hypothetical protein KDK01_17560 [Rhodobacteraceae bacterium]|nr:hypothetical protein [Paracoccaceae bacterium]
MTTINLMIQLPLERADVEEFKRSDLFVIPHLALERPGLLVALATLERHVEGGGNDEAIAAFRVLGEFFARAKITTARRSHA